MGIYRAYPLPFEAIEKLSEILVNTDRDINAIEMKLGITPTRSNHCSNRFEIIIEQPLRRNIP